MPINQMIIDSMLGTFRTMAQDCRDKKMSGPSFEMMLAELEKMESLGREMDDLNAYSAKMATEGHFANFSQYYSQCLSEAAKQSLTNNDDTDDLYLKQTIDAYEKTLVSYHDTQNSSLKPSDVRSLSGVLQSIIDLGRSGISYPVFLRTLIEKGMDKAMEGTVILRDNLVTEVNWAKSRNHPVEIQMREEILSTFDAMANTSPFGIPDSFEFGLRRNKIEWDFAPRITEWKAIQERWEILIDLVNDWLDAFTSFASADDRWVSAAGISVTQKNIRRTQELVPFRLRERLRIFNESFGLEWNDIFEHITFKTAWTNVDVFLSQEKLELIKRAVIQCLPGGHPTDDLVKQAESLRKTHRDFRFDEKNVMSKKLKEEYNNYFGKGAYEKDFR
ncbi:hypothetical protein K1X84_01955 [bacterium]|nr:hypothetical protein [bacterium]